MSIMITVYATYVVLCTIATVWVGRVLLRQGSAYVSHGFDDCKVLTDAMSHLLIVGFYLINFGLICYTLKVERPATDAQTATELLSAKVGVILLMIGVMHFLVMACFNGMRNNAVAERRITPARFVAHSRKSTEFVELIDPEKEKGANG